MIKKDKSQTGDTSSTAAMTKHKDKQENENSNEEEKIDTTNIPYKLDASK